MDIPSSTEAIDKSPSLNVETAMSVLATMDFCPTYFVLGELCQILFDRKNIIKFLERIAREI